MEKLRRFAAYIILALFSIGIIVADTDNVFTYDPYSTSLNPFRGFAAYVNNVGSEDFPTSLEFTYVGLDEILKSEDTYDWSVLENYLQSAASRSNHLILRPYLDYPGNRNALPAFLQTTGVERVSQTQYSDYGGGYSPDYRNTRLISTLQSFIQAFGETYDGDSRLAAVQVGLLGFWGEFHTYPQESLMATRDTQEKILKAFTNSFTTTKVLVSADELDYWVFSTDGEMVPGLGYHDDNFCVGTFDEDNNLDWYFVPKLEAGRIANDRFKSQMIGGEIQPAIQEEIFTSSYTGQSFEEAVAASHASWLLINQVFENSNSKEYVQKAKAASLELGYQFFVSRVQTKATSNDLLTLTVYIQNTGGAPIYYPASLTVTQGNTRFIVIDDLQTSLLPNTGVLSKSVTIPTTESKIVLEISCDMTYTSRPIAFANTGLPVASKIEITISDTVRDASSSASLYSSSVITLAICITIICFSHK